MGVSRKISGFTITTTTTASTDYYTFVRSGTNYQILLSDFISTLGVTGTIVQDGAVTGTPILDVDGTINNIRNLEAGNGIYTSVSAENGATIAHNFFADTDGEPIFLFPNTAEPVIASLVAGEGVELTSTSNHIQIDFTGIPVDIVVVTDLSDFPTPVAGVITLVADTGYQISGDIALGTNRIVASGGNVLFGADAGLASLTYTGTGIMFTNIAGNFKLRDISLSCANGTMFSISSSVDALFQMFNTTITEVATLGTLNNLLGSQFVSVGFNDVSVDGFTFTGTHGAFVMVRSLPVVNAGTMFDLGSASFVSGWSCETTSVSLASGSIFLKGLASSGNMATGALGTLFNTRFNGLGSPLDTITVDDAQWQFFGNDDIQDTRNDALLSHQGSLTVAIATVDTPVKITGTPAWTSERGSQFTIDTNGRATYTGVKDAVFPITSNVAGEPVSGTNKDFTYYIAINGSVVTNSGAKTTITAGGPKNTAILWQASLSTGDYVEMFTENNTDAIDLVVNSAIFRIN